MHFNVPDDSKSNSFTQANVWHSEVFPIGILRVSAYHVPASAGQFDFVIFSPRAFDFSS